ncbi:MAG: hypothetical protein CM15mP113_1140 [Pseudomonadota bacterium]|nr:MAG: hypothetical protein CM15mP113_1140 [Pseudomonadota bacterium]
MPFLKLNDRGKNLENMLMLLKEGEGFLKLIPQIYPWVTCTVTLVKNPFFAILQKRLR